VNIKGVCFQYVSPLGSAARLCSLIPGSYAAELEKEQEHCNFGAEEAYYVGAKGQGASSVGETLAFAFARPGLALVSVMDMVKLIWGCTAFC
jgi:hypothetical protein